MTCFHCGRDLPDSGERCPACGAALPDAPTGATPAPPADDDATVLRPATPAAPPQPRDDETVLRPAATTSARPTARGDETGSADTAPATPASALAGSAPTAPGHPPTALAGSAPTAPAVSSATAAEDAAGPLSIGQQFSARYIIVRLLGIGGMGAVYQAWDGELSVMVALKVIRPEVTRDPAAARDIERRFKQELLLARQVTHKHVVRIHDLGEIDGIKYITMPYIEGEDLADILKKDGRMPVERVMPLARQIADGLAAAHEAGVVHRDLKPANVMIENGHAIIMDFGIARTAGGGTPQGPSASAGGPAAGGPVDADATRAAATVMGTMVGTVQYMAPEQARAQPVDQRADIYAFGLMLYDMLVGQTRAKRAESAIAELQARLTKAPPPVRSIVPEVPDALDRLITRCVEPDPADRFPTTADLVRALAALDDHGRPLPVRRVVRLPLAVAVGVLLLGLSGGIWWYTRPPVQHDPVSVVIADFANGTGDESLNGILETTVQLALEGADFISAYDRAGIRRTLGVRPPEALDQEAARQLAIKNGVGVVLDGAVNPDGRGYRLSVRAVHAVTGEPIVSAEERAGNRDQLLGAATELAGRVRRALGDDESISAQRFAMETLSARSLDVVRDYAAAMEALSRSRFDEALKHFTSAVERDPNFGLAYAGMAIASRNLDRRQDAERFAEQAVSHLDSMTERERYRTRGLFYMVTGDHQACVREYRDLIARYAADAAARNNLALCSTYLRDWPTALDEMKRVVTILPGRALYRENLTLYLSYAGDFAGGEQEAQSMQDPGVFGLLGLAFAQLGQARLADAEATYRAMGKIDSLGASYMASGLGDLAVYQGRFAEAERIFERGAAEDVASDDAFRAASKLTELAYVRLLQGRMNPAMAAADQALQTSSAVKIRFMAARIFAGAGNPARATALAAQLGTELQIEPRAYGKIVEGLVALEGGEARRAVTLLTEANTLLDTWIGHFDLGRAYLEAGAFIQADSEFDRCAGRRGEVIALFLDEEPTWGHLPPLYYYQGRVREELKSAAYRDLYRTYLSIRGNSTDDPLVPEIRRRAGS